MDKGENIEQQDEDGRTLLINASAYMQVDIVKRLIEMGALVNAQDFDGWTALHFAADRHAIEIVELLVNAGATVDIQDKYGCTPLQRAVHSANGRRDVVSRLVSHGANPRQKNHRGISPLDLAQSLGSDVLDSIDNPGRD